jgi:broad specificity phosphatase PhoE
VRRRAVAALHELGLRYPDGAVLIASHGDVIKAVIATSLQMSLDDLECFDIEPASVSVLQLGAGWQKVRMLNGPG